MTPISFALEILLDCETIEEAHKKCRKYIKLLEGQPKLGRGANSPNIAMHPGAPVNLQQAPSTQRLFEQHGAPIVLPPQAAIPVAQRIVGGEVNTGNGTKGPRKF